MQATHLKGDLSGAFANAIVIIPMAIGYGVIALAPLGSEYASKGALMGLYAAVFCGFFSAFVGGTPGQMSGPKAPLALVVASLAAGLLASPLGITPDLILGLICISILIAGGVQILCGSMGLGSVVKYIPHPVVAGFMNGIALLLIIKQLKPLLGVDRVFTWSEIIKNPYSIQPLSTLVGIITIAALFLARGRIKKIPAPFVAFLAGIIVYYLILVLAGPGRIGPVIGQIPTALPKPDALIGLFQSAAGFNLWPVIPTVVLSGIFIGILGAMDSLLSAVVCSNLTGYRTNTKREMLGQGVGNIASALFGGLPGAGSIPGVMTTYAAGGRTKTAGIFSGLAVLLIITALCPLVGKIPLCVIAGIIIAVAWMMLDKQTLEMLTHPKRIVVSGRDVQIDLFINLLVAFITVSVNLLIAVGVGLALASVMFIAKMSKSVIHRRLTGSQIRSKKMRPLEQQAVLSRVGGQTLILELKGPLFFGSADNLAQEVERHTQNMTWCILDMKRVNALDSTGAKILVNIHERLVKSGKYLYLTHLEDHPLIAGSLKAFKLFDALGEAALFSDMDMALEAAEDRLLENAGYEPTPSKSIPMEQMDLFKNFLPEEIQFLKDRLITRKMAKGDKIIRQGDKGREIYLLAKGSVSIKLGLGQGKATKRLISFSPGVMFGEMALLDGSSRSADVVADEEAKVLELPYLSFLDLKEQHPGLATKLILNMTLWLSSRMRSLSEEVKCLEND